VVQANAGDKMKSKKILGVDTSKLLKDSRLDENILGHIPDFMIEQAVDSCVNQLAQHMKSHILKDRSRDPVEKSEAINSAQLVLKDIRNELLEMIQEKLFGFTRR
jgi:hypothetical protein